MNQQQAWSHPAPAAPPWPPRSASAVSALVLALVSVPATAYVSLVNPLLYGFGMALPAGALFLAHLARDEIRASGGRLAGDVIRGVAVAVSWAALALSVVQGGWLFMLLLAIPVD